MSSVGLPKTVLDGEDSLTMPYDMLPAGAKRIK